MNNQNDKLRKVTELHQLIRLLTETIPFSIEFGYFLISI